MEASVDRVVGWLQRAALWLAGVFMLLQTRTIRNKLRCVKLQYPICVAADQHREPALAAPACNGLDRGGHAAKQQKLSV
jgi:hypothetical protein